MFEKDGIHGGGIKKNGVVGKWMGDVGTQITAFLCDSFFNPSAQLDSPGYAAPGKP